MTEDDAGLVRAARAWIEGDPDPETVRELSELVSSGDTAALRERFLPLAFGTAGLRGVVGAGPGRMNRAVVRRTTRAVAEHLLARDPDARKLPVVVGFDARVSSALFADEVVGVLAAAGLPVRYFAEPVPTPLVAYAERALSGSAAVVVTASHNPPEYNGYKLYAASGVQIVPPADLDIERRIREMPPARAIRVAEGAMRGAHPEARPVPDSIVERYFSDLAVLRTTAPADRSVRIVYTALHGVGARFTTRALREAGFSSVTVVPEQVEPDGRFPTVRFPNPEDPRALELALRLAAERDADLVLANDPDADRLAVAVRTPAGRFVVLSGNQVGVLLADFVLEHEVFPRPLVVSTVVSTPMTRAIAKARGARFEETLTGFKWIWNAAMELEESERVRFVFGFEEAIGYSVGRAVRDKDGISAALVFAELAAHCRARGESVLERLASLYERHGVWASAERSVERSGVAGASEIERAVDGLSRVPPNELGGHPVCEVVDYRRGAERRPAWLPAAPLVALDLGPSGRVLVRPSGTEPKLKIYVDLRADAPAGDRIWPVEEELRSAAAAVAEELVRFLGF
jgi:phosphomannomutase